LESVQGLQSSAINRLEKGDYDEFEDRYEFVEYLWKKRFEELQEKLGINRLNERTNNSYLCIYY